MKRIFADTAYWIALLNPRDRLHQRARDLSLSLGRFHLVTSEMVLAELLNDFSARDPELRRSAAQLALRLREMPDVTVFPQTTAGFQEALSLYLERYDKSWSLTDCASFQVMREQGLEEALTYDKHFDQAGFKALLR